MRILHYCREFSALSQTFIYDFINELGRLGVENHVMTLARTNAAVRPMANVHLATPPRWHPWRMNRRLQMLLRMQLTPAHRTGPVLRRYHRILTALRPDMIHAQFGPAGVQIAPVARRLNIPVIVTFHGFDVSRLGRMKSWRHEYNKLWPLTTALTGVSTHICNKLKRLGAPAEKVHRISNGIILGDFQYNCPTERFDDKTVECLFVGRLVEKKAPIALLRSIQAARWRLPPDLNLRLHLVGDGPLMPAVLAFIKCEGLESVVQVHGPCSHDRVKAMMQQAHIYVQHCVTASNGDQEGQGVTLMEAGASGLPVVTTRHNGIPEVVLDGRTGYLVAENDVDHMGDRIAFLATHPERWRTLGQAARLHIEQSMNLKTQTALWRDFYRSIINRDQKGTQRETARKSESAGHLTT